MSDLNNDQQELDVSVSTDGTSVDDGQGQQASAPIDYNDVIKDLQEQIRSIKSSQQGVDQVNTKLRKQLDEKNAEIEQIKETYLSETQKLEIAKKQEAEKLSNKEEELKQQALELERKNKELLINNFMVENNVDRRLKGYLTGSSVDELTQQYEGIKGIIEEGVSTGIKQVISDEPIKGVQQKADIPKHQPTGDKAFDLLREGR